MILYFIIFPYMSWFDNAALTLFAENPQERRLEPR